MPTAALIAGLQAGAGGMQAGGQIMGGFQQQAESRSEAKMLEQQGQIASTNAYGQIAANDIEARQRLGEVNTEAAASGVKGSSGSVRAVRSMNESMAILRDTYAKYRGETAEQSSYYQARAARYQGNQAMYGGLIAGAGSLLTAGASAAETMRGTGSPKANP